MKRTLAILLGLLPALVCGGGLLSIIVRPRNLPDLRPLTSGEGAVRLPEQPARAVRRPSAALQLGLP